MGFLTRLIAGLVAASTLGAGLAGTAGAVDTTGATGDAKGVVKLASDDTSGLSDHLVNGDFEYPGVNVLSKNRYDEKDYNWWGVSRKDKMVYDPSHETQWVSLPSTFDSDRFAWDSTEVAGVQNGSSQWHTNEVELQRDSRTGQTYAELCAYQAHTSIRQYIHTTPGTLYKVRLKHASLSRDYLDKMQVLVGPAGNEQPVRMTRVESQNGLDATGESTASTTVSTHASNEMEIKDGQGTPYSSRNHNGQWATYEGVYVATSDVTSFTFKSVDAKAYNLGNLLDDIVFDKAYKLSYDKNATDANGSVPSDETAGATKQAKASTTGTLRLASDDDVATYAASNLPEQIVNGGFDYPSVPSWTALGESGSNKYNKGKLFATINPGTGKYGSGCAMSTTGRAIPNWNRLNFAWNSTQGDTHYSGGMSCEAGNVELNYDSVHHNQFAELTADQQGTAIYQDVKVTPGTMMKWSLKHSSATSAYVDKMQVLIGEPYKETAQEATRITSENGNKVGEKMTTISTPTTSDRADNKKWDTYSGTYLVPDEVTTVRFTFKSIASAEWYSGNDLDDIEFSRSYKLTYDKNAQDVSGQVPSNQRGKENAVQPAEAKTTGTVKTVADDDSSKSLTVNPGFDVPDYSKLNDGGLHWMYVSPAEGEAWSFYDYINPAHPKHQVAGLSQATFGWQELTGGDYKTTLFELHREKDGNVCADVHGSRTIGQTIDTQAGVAYTVSIRHSGRSKGNAGSVQVLVGPDKNHLRPLEMSRMNVSRTGAKYGDRTGKVGTVITTHSDSVDSTEGNHPAWDHSDDWETYSGTYVATGGKTVFAYRGVDKNGNAVSVIDDLSFKLAYPLVYDKNAGDATGSVPSSQYGKENTVQPAKAKTNGTVKTVVDTSDGLPTELVNGDFEYPGADVLSQNLRDKKRNWWGVSRKDKMVYESANPTKWVSLPSTFDSDRFAWDSSEAGKTSGVQEGSSQWHTNEVELQRDSRTGNMYAELSPYQAQSSIRQYIRTTPGALYKVRLKHASLSSEYLDKMQVLIGADGNEQPVRMTRVESQNGLDAIGESTASTTISTHASNKAEISWGSGLGYHSSRNHHGQWATYEGVYVATSDVTVFTFKSVDSPSFNTGNLLDDVAFTKAYKLTYDKNSADASGEVPSNQRGRENTTQPAKDKTSGTVRLASDDDVVEYAANGLPKQLVNSDFDHDWRNIVGQSKMTDKYNFANVDPAHGDVEISGALNGKGEASKHWVHLNGFDAAKFGWKSNQTDTRVDGRGGIVEIQRSKANDNMYAEITASQANTYLYQDIDTAHDSPTVYTVKLRYAHRNGTVDSNEKIQILVGAPGHEQPVEMTRIASDRGNKVGEKSTTVNAPNTDGWLGSWDTFQGSVEIPAGQPVSRFTFKALGSVDGVTGNLIDDVQFKLAYPLSYDKNAQDATGSVPSSQYGKENTVQPAKAKTTGSVGLAADKTASSLTVHDLEMNDVPADYRQFILSTTDTRLSQVEFEDGAWYKSTDPSSQGMWPLRIGSSLTIPSVGDWTDPSGKTHQISMTMRLKDWNGGSVSELYRFDGHGNIVGDGRFWINTAYGSGYSSLPAKVKAAMGGVDTSKRVGCSWTVEFTYADTGEKVPDTFKGVTGFNDLDGWDAQSDLKFEGVQLLSGFDGAYKRSDAELGTYGTNGFAGIGHDAGDEAHLNAPQQSRHRLAATWTGSTFTFSYDLSNPAGRTDGSRMTFGAPVTRTAVLTYDKNAADASGQVPSNTTPDTTQTASSKSTGKVSDLVQRTTTHEDGSVTVRTVDQSTDVVSGCQVYYPAGQRITLATLAKDGDCWDSSMLTRPGHTQLGWSQDSQATQAQAEVTMVEGGMTVYAVWVGNPVLTYDTNKPNTWNGQMPSTPASVSVAYNTAAADGSGWQSGDTSKIRGYRFLGWYAGPQDDSGLYDWNTLLTGNVTVYAHWQRLQANVVYDANGGTGSHASTPGWQYSDVTVPSDTSKSFKRDGYVFLGWDTQADGNGTAYKDGSQVPLQDKDIVLFAQWRPVFEQFTPTGGVSLPLLVAGGVTLLVMGIGSTVMLTRRMRGEQ